MLTVSGFTASAINTAIANAGANGDVVYMPAGTYTIDANVGVPANVSLRGDLTGTLLQLQDDKGVFVNGDNVTLEEFRFTGSTSTQAIYVSNNVVDLTIRAVLFRGSLPTCIRLFNNRKVTVDSCLFDGVGYGVLQQRDYASYHVRVLNCRAMNMTGDFVEIDSVSVQSAAWLIHGNNYTGTPTSGSELRFIGVTNADGVQITNNFVWGVGGDAAVHLEGSSRNIQITANHFENCRTAGGNLGYIYVLTSDADVLITGNTFYADDTSAPMRYAVDTGNSSISPKIVFTANRVAAAAGCSFGALSLSFNAGYTMVQGNQFAGLSTAIRAVSALNVRVADNDFIGCVEGISTQPGEPSGGGGNNWIIDGNRFAGTSSFCLRSGRNTNGTGAPTNLMILNNMFDAEVRVYDGVDIYAQQNMQATTGLVLDVSASQYSTPTRTLEVGTYVVGSGQEPMVISNQPTTGTASGGAYTVPGTCAAFWSIGFNGSTYKIPVYN